MFGLINTFEPGDKLNSLLADRWFVFAALVMLGLIAVIATIKRKF